MKAIYFSDQPKYHYTKKLLTMSTLIASKIAPKSTLKLSYKYLMNPFSKREVQFDQLQPDKTFKVNSKLGSIHLNYFKGGDKNILLTHGWGDTSRSFRFLIQKLQEAGYSIWVFDHIGHGNSDGFISHLPGFIDGLNSVLNYLKEENINLESIITHSMGGSAVLNLEEHFLINRKIILISVPIKVFDNLFDKIVSVGISKNVLVNLLNDISTTFQSDWKELDPEKHQSKIHHNFLFIHDEDDKISPFKDLQKIKQGSPHQLFSTSGLGHRKILRDKRVHNKILEFLNA